MPIIIIWLRYAKDVIASRSQVQAREQRPAANWRYVKQLVDISIPTSAVQNIRHMTEADVMIANKLYCYVT